MELLKAEPWDGNDRLTEIYKILGLTNDFHKVLVRKWALQTIAVLYNTEETPIAAQGVLVLQGVQGIGKTEFFRHLAIDRSFFKGGATLDMTNKDSIMSATRVWICELGEIDNTTKKEQSSLKAFLTEQVDRYREPYAANEVIRLRRTSFCGTVNPKCYLRDETGNRRYWTVPVKNIDIERIFGHLPEWYAQFWRQIHAEYLQNPKGYLLTREEHDFVNENNKEFEAEVYGEDEFMSFFDATADVSKWEWKTAAQVADLLNTEYSGLKIGCAAIGRLYTRFEERIGEPFDRKKISGRRFIFCPPVSNATSIYLPVPKIDMPFCQFEEPPIF
jgi:predicted P-loop ATPase